MLSLQSKLQYIGKAFNDALPGLVFHYWRPNNFPYCVWQEESEADSLWSDNTKTEQAISCTADYYTKTEYDTNIDLLQDVLNNISSAWRIEAVQYEEDTKLIHYTFAFEVREVNEILESV